MEKKRRYPCAAALLCRLYRKRFRRSSWIGFIRSAPFPVPETEMEAPLGPDKALP